MCMMLVVASFCVELGCGLVVAVDELSVPVFVFGVFVFGVVVEAVVGVAPVDDAGTGLLGVVADEKGVEHLGSFFKVCLAVAQEF
jgi:hypothetical protein